MPSTLPRRAAAAPIWLYRALISPWLPPRCRFTPTCSAYALEAIERHGTARGLWLAARRVARCHPWSRCPHHDPVPPPVDNA
jgi:uncharacterized protein